MAEINHSTADDTVLVRAAQKDDMSAFEELVARHRDKIYARAFSMMRNEEEAVDLSQEAWVKGWQRLNQFQGESGFATWMTRIVINLCLDQLRKRQVRKEDAPVAKDSEGEEYDVLSQVPDGRAAANPERDLMRRELGGRINRALEKLTPRERMVFELKHYQGLKLRTVGEILNTTEETAKNTLFRATQKLRGALGDMR